MRDPLGQIIHLLETREVKKAEVVLSRYLRTSPVEGLRVQALIYRARARLLMNRPQDALGDLEDARLLEPDRMEQPDILELMGDCYLLRFEMASVGFSDRADTEQARACYARILSEYPTYGNAGWIHYQLGRIALTNNEVETAEKCFKQALLEPSQVSALTTYCYERLGFIAFYEHRQLNAAVGFLAKAIDTFPAGQNQGWLVQVYILQSRVWRELRNYDQALLAAENAVATASSNALENRSSLADALITASELLAEVPGGERRIIAYIQQFLQNNRRPLGIDVTWSRAYEMQGDAYARLKQYDPAIESYEMALAFNPYHPWKESLYYRIGRCHYQQRTYASVVTAIDSLLAALRAENEAVEDYRVYDLLGNALFALGHYDQAADAYQKALRLAPVNADGVDKIKAYFNFAQELS